MEKVRFREIDIIFFKSVEEGAMLAIFGHLNQYKKMKCEILMHNYLQMKSAN